MKMKMLFILLSLLLTLGCKPEPKAASNPIEPAQKAQYVDVAYYSSFADPLD